MKLLKLRIQDDPYKARINTLYNVICEDETYIRCILSMLIAYCKTFPADDYHALPKMEERLEEALFWYEDWEKYELSAED